MIPEICGSCETMTRWQSPLGTLTCLALDLIWRYRNSMGGVKLATGLPATSLTSKVQRGC